MSGSGALLIPLLKKNLAIEAVDNSTDMINSCLERAVQEQVKPIIYNQSITELALPKKYAGILVTFSSFQLIHDYAQALKVLTLFHAHIKSNGVLLLECFIPWDMIKDSIKKDVPLTQAGPFYSARQVITQDTIKINLKTTITVYTPEQYMISNGVFEKLDSNGCVLEQEYEEHTIRWYYQYEMKLLLEKAGFMLTHVYRNTHHLEPQDMLFQAIKIIK